MSEPEWILDHDHFKRKMTAIVAKETARRLLVKELRDYLPDLAGNVHLHKDVWARILKALEE